ncbi:MAG: flagellar motor protein MotB [Myxococcota bacterium]
MGQPEQDDPPVQEGAPAWMATFGDMMSLLLCFFVLLLSFANMDIIKFREMKGSLEDAFGVTKVNPGSYEVRSTSPIELSDSDAKPQVDLELPPVPPAEQRDEELLKAVQKFIENRALEGIVEAVPGDRGVTIRIKGTLMFESASDELRAEGQPVFDEIVDLAARFPYKIAVEGHTDDRPINTPRFKSNWELSAARAVAGVHYLIRRGGIDPERISATGYAHTRPIALGDTEEARAANRRLEFVFFREDDVEPSESGEAPISPGTFPQALAESPAAPAAPRPEPHTP